MRQMINLRRNWEGDCLVAYPLYVSCNGREQLQIGAIEAAATHSVSELVDMPEKVGNFVMANDDLIVCSGNSTHALYAVSLQVRNLEELLAHNIKKEGEAEQEEQ